MILTWVGVQPNTVKSKMDRKLKQRLCFVRQNSQNLSKYRHSLQHIFVMRTFGPLSTKMGTSIHAWTKIQGKRRSFSTSSMVDRFPKIAWNLRGKKVKRFINVQVCIATLVHVPCEPPGIFDFELAKKVPRPKWSVHAVCLQCTSSVCLHIGCMDCTLYTATTLHRLKCTCSVPPAVYRQCTVCVAK